MKHNLLKSLIISVILVMGVSNAWGTLVGVAGSNPHNYTVKINVQRTYTDNGKDWLQQNMTQAPKGMTFEGKKLYIIGYGNTNINGVEKMQFQYYSGNTWKEEVQAITSWKTTDNHAHPYGCIYNYDEKKWYENGDFLPKFNFYFDATGWNQTSLSMCIGHANWHNYDKLTKIPNTNLYYGTRTTKWGGAAGMCVVGNTTEDEGGNLTLLTISQNATEFSGFRNYILQSAGNTAYLMVNKGNAGQMPDMYYYDNFSSLNHIQTIKTVVDGTIANSKANIAIKSYQITGNGVATEQNNSLTTSLNTATISAARTATTTLTVSKIEAGYKFDGWYDAETGGNRLSPDPTYIYYPTSAKTIYARFSKDNIFVVRGGEQFGNTWDSDVNVMTKKNEFEQIVYYTVSITGRNLNESNTAYQFKIYDKTTNKWYGLAAGDMHFWYTRDIMSGQDLVEGDAGKNIELRADVPGEYVIKVDYSEGTPKITITYPEKHTVTLHPISKTNGYSDYGYFIVAYGGITYTSSPTETIKFDVASGSTITIVESQHRYPDIYNGDICWRVTGTTWNDWKNINNPINYPITVNDNIEISDNFVVRKEAVDKNITPNAGIHIFLRIRTNLMDEWIAKDKEETGSNIRPGYKGNEFANFIYLCDYSTPGHTIQGSTPEDRGCPKLSQNDDKEQPNGHFLMYDLNIDDANYKYYYCTITDSCWYHIKFERKHADSDPENGGFFEVRAGDFPGNEKTCYSIDNYSNGTFSGSWVEAPKCKVKVNYPDMGKYGVEYNGEMHYATSFPRHTEIFYVPFKSQIKIFEGEHDNPAYTKTVALIENGSAKQRYEFSEQVKSYTHTVIGDVTFDDLFATKQAHDVYIGVAKKGLPQAWYDAGYYMYNYYHKPYGEANLLAQVNYLEDNEYIYYKYELPAGVAYFDFQRKTGINDQGTPHAQTNDLHNVLFPNINCFILDGGIQAGRYTGYWIAMPADKDFRILYVEQIVTKKEQVGDEWITEVKRTYEHSSDLIKPSELNPNGKIVSLHIYTRGKNPEIILQQYDAKQKKWVDIEAHMVNGPLETDDPGMALLPGRKNATPGSDIDDFVYDDGIEKIKNDPTDDGCGVWNFTVYENGESAKLNLVDGLERYNGRYYIRTDNAEGQWSQYNQPSNYMTFSSYAKKHSGFSHYFCKWLDVDIHFNSVSFIIANDYAHSLTDPSSRFEDPYIDNQWLPENANVRWGWDIVTNKVSRAYIQGTWTTAEPPARIHNLVLDYKPNAENSNKTVLLHDSGDWIYAINLTDTKVGSHLNSLTAKYPSTHTSPQVFAEDIDMITGENDNKNTYTVRVQYDFKIDHTLIALLPNDKKANIGIDVVIERTNNNEDATQVMAPVTSAKTVTQEDGSTLAGSTVYGVFTFTKKFLTDDKSYTNQERFTHWFSFPFDVKLSDVFGFSPVGDYWMIRKYNGDKRAAEGLNETNTFWEYERNSEAILKANTGYILVLSTNLKQPDRDIYINRDTLSLYFPATDLVTNINSDYFETPVEVPQHKNQNTTIKDWNWNMIGMPSYANKQQTIKQDHLYYFYDYSHKTNSYEVVWSGEKSFKSTFAYMVQFAGTIDWKGFNFTKAQGLAPRERTDEEIQKHVLRLDLHRAGAREDKTYIQLIDENATTDFDMNLDLTKMLNSSKSNLYSLLQNYKLAANVLPIEEAIIPLGVVSATAGEYTFAMPNGTDGIVVELIDYETNTRTNMLLDEYTVNLGKGTFENRFALHVKPDKTTTSVDNLGNEATGDKVKKYLIDGVLYMQKDGVLYDAQGRCVQ